MANAAHIGLIYVKTSSPADVEIDGVKQIDPKLMRIILETTDFKGGAFRTRITGLKDSNISMSGDFEDADTAFTTVRTAFLAGTTVFVRWLPDGSNGFESEYVVEELSLPGQVEQTAGSSMTFRGTGDITWI
jgi:predicted secreted protein